MNSDWLLQEKLVVKSRRRGWPSSAPKASLGPTQLLERSSISFGPERAVPIGIIVLISTWTVRSSWAVNKHRDFETLTARLRSRPKLEANEWAFRNASNTKPEPNVDIYCISISYRIISFSFIFFFALTFVLVFAFDFNFNFDWQTILSRHRSSFYDCCRLLLSLSCPIKTLRNLRVVEIKRKQVESREGASALKFSFVVQNTGKQTTFIH